MPLVIILVFVIFAFIAVSPKEFTQTVLAGAWILSAILAVGSTLYAIIQQL